MINKIIDAISVSIHSEFGNAYEIYTESVEQGLQEPCFSVFCLNPSYDQFLGKRYFRQNQLCIQFFPPRGEANKDSNAVRERLFSCLAYIRVTEELTRGSQMRGEFDNGVLSFFVNYDLFEQKVGRTAPMEQLESGHIAVKG